MEGKGVEETTLKGHRAQSRCAPGKQESGHARAAVGSAPQLVPARSSAQTQSAPARGGVGRTRPSGALHHWLITKEARNFKGILS